MIDTSFLKGLARFNLIVKKRVTSNYAGPRKSIAQGRGIIFKDHRIYAPGDDYRAIDWRVFARTDDLMVKNYEEEKNLIVHIILDVSKSMGYGKKFDYAAMLGIGHAYLAMKNNDKFQLATFAEDIQMVQPRRGLSQVMAMLDYMNKLSPSGKTDFLACAKRYRKLMGSRSLVIIISDFLMDTEIAEQALYYFSGHEVKVIRVLDEKEKYPEMQGDFKLKDSESGQVMRAFLSPQSHDQYTKRLAEHSAEIEQACNSLGMDFYEISTDKPIFDAFYEILHG